MPDKTLQFFYSALLKNCNLEFLERECPSMTSIFSLLIDFYHNNNSDWPSLAGLPDGIPGLHVSTEAHKVTNFALDFIFGLHTLTLL